MPEAELQCERMMQKRAGREYLRRRKTQEFQNTAHRSVSCIQVMSASSKLLKSALMVADVDAPGINGRVGLIV